MGLVLDRSSRRVMIVCSKEIGMEIEEIAADQPNSIIGQAIATMDTIKLAGGESANFLNIGGGTLTALVTLF